MYGEWWVEQRVRLPRPYVPPKHTAAGDLIDEGFTGWRLETIGPLVAGPLHPPDDDAGRPREPATLWGTDRDGFFYSLLDAGHARTTHQSPSARGGVQAWSVGAIVKSRDVWVKPEDVVDRIDVHFRDLDAWASDPSLRDTELDGEAKRVSFSSDVHTASATVRDRTVEVLWGRDWSMSAEMVSASPGALVRIVGTLPVSA